MNKRCLRYKLRLKFKVLSTIMDIETIHLNNALKIKDHEEVERWLHKKKATAKVLKFILYKTPK